jgi:hypothetical protein
VTSRAGSNQFRGAARGACAAAAVAKKRTFSQIDETSWQFACTAAGQRDTRHVDAFVEKHALEPETLSCSFPVEGLTVDREIEVFGVTLTPANAAELPEEILGLGPRGPIGSVVTAECFGTNGRKMKQRARQKVQHALRLLRRVCERIARSLTSGSDFG